ncbi:PREDICTED: uncharacterized protein LOC104819117 [Tarenaya hassleriana]|uniref:uncharacterized protein LOC104819117 n=1 Tax=Tarenaya hassleriana TaxID=28532 RepID=UPI00053C17E8|nr:PREDICTED: uncharacterized protein LOC104819117 [Tarenaya hassleriana]
MRLEERFEAVNRYRKKVFWMAKAAVKKAVRNNGGGGVKKKKKQLRFQYDPSSYALNFDDGGGASPQRFSGDVKNITWVYYVVFVESCRH